MADVGDVCENDEVADKVSAAVAGEGSFWIEEILCFSDSRDLVSMERWRDDWRWSTGSPVFSAGCIARRRVRWVTVFCNRVWVDATANRDSLTLDGFNARECVDTAAAEENGFTAFCESVVVFTWEDRLVARGVGRGSLR